MPRFEEPFHMSHLKTFQGCNRAFQYGQIYDLEREKSNWAALSGTAGHDTIEMAHRSNTWKIETLMDFFEVRAWEKYDKAIEQDREVTGHINIEKSRAMIQGYIDQPWNREAEVMFHEKNFYLTIKPFKTPYKFEGRIDQLLRIPAELLKKAFPSTFANFPRDTVLMHRDLKFGQRRQCSQFELSLDVQFSVYALALKFGEFRDADGGLVKLGLVPDIHCKYHVADHVPYSDDRGTYQKNENDEHVPCHIVETRCVMTPGVYGKTDKGVYLKGVGENYVKCPIRDADKCDAECKGLRATCTKQKSPDKLCKGLRSYCTRQSRGPAMYFTTRPESCLEQKAKDIGYICADIKKGLFPPRLGDLCFNYCGYKSYCESEAMENLDPGW